MKKYLRRLSLLALIPIVGSYNALYAQNLSVCGTTKSAQRTTQTSGYNVTSFGTIKALFIFIDFPDDNVDVTNPTWPMQTDPLKPALGFQYLNDIVDSTETQNSGKYANVSTFFNDQSNGKFKMIGKAYYVQAPHALAWYQANNAGAEVAYSSQDAIQILDSTINFADFDQWIDAPYNHRLGTDGILDMVFICYRRWYICDPPSLYCSSFQAEGWYNASLPDTVYVNGNSRKIVGSHAVDVLNMINYPDWGMSVENVVHEFGHVWGLDHQYAPGMWSLMGQRGPSTCSCINSLEREQLGWSSYIDITSSQPASLRDFSRTGDAYRVSLGNGEYYIVENHQMLSPYDTPDISTGAKGGIYILQQSANGVEPGTEGSLRVVPADGRWNWTTSYWKQNPYGPGTDPTDIIPVFNRGLSNRYTGQSDHDVFSVYNPNSSHNGYVRIYLWLDEITGALRQSVRFKGDGRDRWNTTDNNLLSPWSNPAGSSISGVPSNFAIQVTSEPQAQDPLGTINAQFFIGNPGDAPPSKPQDVHALLSGSNSISLSWIANIDQNMTQSGTHGYDVYRSIYYDGATPSYTKVNSMPDTSSSFTDNPTIPGGIPVGKDVYWRYNVKAIDNTTKVSVASDEAWLLVSKPNATPATNITSTSFTANWTVVSGATEYFLDVATDTGFTVFVGGYRNLAVDNVISRRVTGLSPNTTYYYRVRAYSGFPISNSNTITVLTAPAAPPATNATLITFNSFTANWTAVSGATAYYFDVATDSGFTVFVDSYKDRYAGNATSFPISGLNNTTYYYRVRAANSYGTTSPNSITITVLTGPLATNATNITSTSFSANWDSVTIATSYRLDVSTSPRFGSFISGYQDKDVGKVITSSVTGLSANTPYWYRMRAYYNGAAGPNSNIISVKTAAAPAAPTNLTVTGATQTQINLSWDTVSGATVYNVYQNGSPIPVSIYTNKFIVGVSCGTTHSYYVKAGNAGGWSGASDTVIGTAIACTPTLVSPADSATNLSISPICKWKTSSGAALYRLQVSTKDSLSSTVFDDSTLTDTTKQLSNLSYATTYYWHVNAKNVGGTSA
ncbi:MAG: hypothetical protein ABR936_11260, partial [Bacteroidota bacterium]